MATTTRTGTVTKTKTKTLVCFSFAAYAKTLIDHLKSLNIPVLHGLTDQEFTSIETTFNFTFPPDLRSILQEGVPIGPHFPNWRSSSPQQLQILLNLPLLNLSRNIDQNNFWVPDSWGDRPLDNEKAMLVAKKLLNKAPVLVPLCRNCYIPCSPHASGNPVFYVDDKEVKVLSFDVERFFQEAKFLHNYSNGGGDRGVIRPTLDLPAWAATAARRVEFWTDVAERGRIVVARGDTRGWWNDSGELVGCLEEVFWKLRDAGWREEEVREMMMMNGRDHDNKNNDEGCRGALSFDFEEEVVWQVRVLSLSLELLRAGWSMEDVLYSLDLEDCHGQHQPGENKSFLEFHLPIRYSTEDDHIHDHHLQSNIKLLMKLQSLEV